MKRILLLVLLGGFFLAETSAQEIELTGFYGYTFGSKVRTYYGDYKTNDAPNYGGILSVGIAPDLFVELSWNHLDTEIKYYYNNILEPLGLATDYIQLGGIRQVPVGNGNILPFAGAALGASVFSLKESGGDFSAATKWMMAATLSAGVKMHLGNMLGIRLQARLGLPMSFNGLWIGTGGTGASFRVPMVQFDLSAGVFLRLGT